MTEVLRRADELLEILGLSKTDELRATISAELRVRSYHGLVGAATLVAKARTSPDPWQSALNVHDTNCARLSVLYSLTHWAEVATRAAVDLRMCEIEGREWYLDPSLYLAAERVDQFKKDLSQGTYWRKDAPSGGMVPNYPTSWQFLDSVNLGWLVQIVAFAYSGLGNAFVRADGTTAPASEVLSLLGKCNETRKKVAHNALIESDAYSAATRDLGRLLSLLGLSVPEEFRRTEQLRAEYIKRLPAPISRSN